MKIPKKRGKIPDAMTGGYNQEKGLVDLLMDDIRNGDFRLKTHQSTANGLMVEQNSWTIIQVLFTNRAQGGIQVEDTTIFIHPIILIGNELGDISVDEL